MSGSFMKMMHGDFVQKILRCRRNEPRIEIDLASRTSKLRLTTIFTKNIKLQFADFQLSGPVHGPTELVIAADSLHKSHQMCSVVGHQFGGFMYLACDSLVGEELNLKMMDELVSAINDPAIDLEYMCYLIKFDSSHGKYTGSVTHDGKEIKINEHPIKVFHHKAPADVPWHEAGVQYVVEASGMFTSVEKASGHLGSDGVRRVIVTAPSADAPMLILGVNDDAIQPDVKVVSCASSTLYCLAPIVKVLEDAYGVVDGFVTSIHAMTPSLKPLDGLCVRGKHWRDHRSIHQNIIPASTGACRALGRIIPSCKDKLCGLAFRVPVVGVSVLDMCVRLNKNTTIKKVSQTIEKLNNTALGSIIRLSNEKAVSSDFIGETHSCILDIDSSLQINPNFLKLICWYENEYSYSCRVVDTVIFSERQFQRRMTQTTRVMYLRPLPFETINLQRAENSPGCIRRQSVSFCVPKLQNTWTNMKPGSRSFIMRSVTASESPKHQLAESTDPHKKTTSFKTFIDSFTKCKCNETQDKASIIETKKDTLDNNERTKAKECLKAVEKEISEMLNLTQSFLNKSSNRKLQSAKHELKKIPEKDLEERRNLMRKNIIAKISDTLENIRKEKMNAKDVGFSGDQTSLVLDVDDYQDTVSQSTREAGSLNSSQLKLSMCNSSAKLQIVNNATSSNVAVDILNTGIDKKNVRDSSSRKIHLNHSDHNKSQTKHVWQMYKVNKTNSFAEKHENIISSVKYDTDDATSTVISETDESLNDKYKSLNVALQNKAKEHFIYLKKLDEEGESNRDSGTAENAPANQNIIQPAVVVISNANTDTIVESISNENKKQPYAELANNVSVNTLREIKNDSDDIRCELVDDTTVVTNQGLAGCSSGAIDNSSDMSLSGSHFTDRRQKNNPCIEDIYDKLDSESMSDSGSSLRIHEKVSQVIRITDLTYSLEDLPRLDKICRVIEISDELSDKLFSPLDTENCTNTPGRTWSFQDLCERIKFDEFCNELFEKPAT